MYYRIGGRYEKERYAFTYLSIQQFLKIKCENKSTSYFFEANNYHNIIIYGANELTKCLINDLQNSSIVIKYCIDQEFNKYTNGINGIKVYNNIQDYNNDDIFLIIELINTNFIIDTLLANNVNINNIITLSDVVWGI